MALTTRVCLNSTRYQVARDEDPGPHLQQKRLGKTSKALGFTPLKLN